MLKIKDFTLKLCQLLELEENVVEIKVNETENRLEINLYIPEEEAAFFIGSRGDTLLAIEYLLKTIFKDDYPEKRIVLDINDYKGRKLDALRDRTIRIAEQVVETGRSYSLNYLNSYERYIVHSTLVEEGFDELESFSDDINGDRVLTIALKAEDKKTIPNLRDTTESFSEETVEEFESDDDFNEEIGEIEDNDAENKAGDI